MLNSKNALQLEKKVGAFSQQDREKISKSKMYLFLS